MDLEATFPPRNGASRNRDLGGMGWVGWDSGVAGWEDEA